MDFPILLEKEEFVSGIDELEQTMKLLLIEEKGSFLQDFRLGSQITPHIKDSRLLHAAILDALSPLKSVKVEDIDISNNGELIEIIYTFLGELRTFEFKNYDNP